MLSQWCRCAQGKSLRHAGQLAKPNHNQVPGLSKIPFLQKQSEWHLRNNTQSQPLPPTPPTHTQFCFRFSYNLIRISVGSKPLHQKSIPLLVLSITKARTLLLVYKSMPYELHKGHCFLACRIYIPVSAPTAVPSELSLSSTGYPPKNIIFYSVIKFSVIWCKKIWGLDSDLGLNSSFGLWASH